MCSRFPSLLQPGTVTEALTLSIAGGPAGTVDNAGMIACGYKNSTWLTLCFTCPWCYKVTNQRCNTFHIAAQDSDWSESVYTSTITKMTSRVRTLEDCKALVLFQTFVL